MNELLPSGTDYVNDTGDVLPVDQAIWQPVEFVPDHAVGDSNEELQPVSLDYYNSSADGASVSLKDRADYIKSIMAYFNQANKMNGLQKSQEYNGFGSRYGSGSGAVIARMSLKEQKLHGDAKDSFNRLVGSEALKAVGFDARNVDAGAQRMRQELYNQYGPGQKGVGAQDRAKLVKRVEGTRDAVLHRKPHRAA